MIKLPFNFKKTEIPEVKIVEPEVFGDGRGFFMETYVKEEFVEAGIDNDFIQDNHSRSEKNVLRGLHFQKGEYAQAKLVRCTKGKILDVAADIRENSPTFGEYVAIELSEENKKQLFLPRGFAHGFYTISEIADVQYKIDNDYAPEKEGGIIWNDPQIGIDWPTDNPKLSDKDKEWPNLDKIKKNNQL